MSRLIKTGGARERGFTLVELMVTIAVASILAATALPYLGAFIDRSRARAVAIELESALNYARAEAIARSGDVSICALAAPGTTTCAASDDGTAWANGWLVRDVASNSNLRVSPTVVPSQITIGAGSRGSFVFSRTGLTGTDAGLVTTGTLKISRNSGGTLIPEACLIINSMGGRIRRGTVSGTNCS